MSYIHYRKDEETLGVLIKRLLKAYGLDVNLREVQLKQAWFDVVGPLARNYSENPVIKGRKMYVTLKSAAFRQELAMHKTQMLEDINAKADCPGFLQDIVLR